jgi:tripeptidyl-peptidase-1
MVDSLFFASIANRLNGERIAVGKKPIGFLNPILYRFLEMFNDVTEGYNLECNATRAFVAQ